MTWLGHENLCASQWGKRCNCPCPHCGALMDTAGHRCDLFAVLDAMADPDDDEPVDLSESPPEPRLQAELDRLEREDPAVAKASKGLDVVYGNVGAGLSRAELKAIYDPPEPRYLGTLGPDELED